MSCLALESKLYKHNLKTRKATSSFSASGRSRGRSGYASSLFSRSRKICEISRASRKGPKDGWHGLTLKILRYVVERGVVTRREIEKAFGLSQNGVLYHLKKLRDWGFVIKVGSGPATIYKFAYWGGRHGVHASGCWGAVVGGLLVLGRVRRPYALVKVWFALCLGRVMGRALSSEDIAFRTGFSKRHVQRCLRRLVGLGLAVRLGGRRCRFSKYLPCVLGRPIVHVHRYTRGHRYRYRRRVLGKVC